MVAELAKQLGVSHLIYLSSISIYTIQNEGCNDIYSLSKLHGEQVINFYSKKSQLSLLVLRLTQIYDSMGHCQRHQPFLYTIINKAAKNESVLLYGQKDPVRNYLHVDDLSEIIYRAITIKLTGTFDCVFPDFLSLSQIVNMTYEIYQIQRKAEFDDTKENIKDFPISECDDSIYKKIQFFPRISLREGIQAIKKNQS